MALLTALPLEAAQRLGHAFGVEVLAVEPLAAGSVNSNFRLLDRAGRPWFARLYEEQGAEGAAAERALLHALHLGGVPVVQPLPGPPGAEHQGRPFAIYPWLEGEILCQPRVTAAACRRVGEALGRVHTAPVPALPPGRFDREGLLARLDRVEREGSAALAAVAVAARPRLLAWWARRDPALPAGLVHGDLFRDNVLWRDGALLALLDFESAARGALAYDLAVCLHAWCFGERFEPALVAALFEGYGAVRPLSAEERAGFRAEAAVAALRFVCTRLTDYSLRAAPGQPPVRDYRRFVARLEAVEAGALDPPLAAAGAAS